MKSPCMLHKAKALRSKPTEAEQRLWYHLRAHRFRGLKFKRQKPIGHYIADFVCLEHRLIIEVDGSQHAEQVLADQCRTAELQRRGYTVLRFWNNEVMQQMECVLEQIDRVLSLSLDPSPTSGRGESTDGCAAEATGFPLVPGRGESTDGCAAEAAKLSFACGRGE